MKIEFRYVWRAPFKNMSERPITLIPYIERSPYIGYWGHYTCVCISFFIWVVVVNIK